MEEDTIWDKIRDFIGKGAFNLFLWSIKSTKENYWEEIYQQEKLFKKQNNKGVV